MKVCDWISLSTRKIWDRSYKHGWQLFQDYRTQQNKMSSVSDDILDLPNLKFFAEIKFKKCTLTGIVREGFKNKHKYVQKVVKG